MDMKPIYKDEAKPNSYESGKHFEALVAQEFKKRLNWILTPTDNKYAQRSIGDFKEGVEAKEDSRILDTGNVSIEVAEKKDTSWTQWIDSGILRNDKSWLYVQGNDLIIFIFAKKTLINLYNNKYFDKVWEPIPTIRTFLMPIDEAEILALQVWRSYRIID